MRNLKIRSKNSTLGDLLPYLSVDQDQSVIWLKNGSATKTFSISPKNSLSFTDQELEQVRIALNSVLTQLPEHTLIQFFMTREKTKLDRDLACRNWINTHTGDNFESNYDKLYEFRIKQLNTLWEQEELYQTRIFMTVAVDPSAVRSQTKMGAFSHLIFLRNLKKQHKACTDSVDSILHKLDDICESLKAGFEPIGFEIEEVKSEDKLNFIYRFLNPERDIPLHNKTIAAESMSDYVSLTDLIETKKGLSLGRTKVTIATLKTFPEHSLPCLSTAFAALKRSFSMVFTILVLPQIEEREWLTRKQRIAQAMASGNTVRNLFAEIQLQDIEDTLTAMISNGNKLLATSIHLLTFGDDEKNLLSEAEKIGNGCQWFEETIGAYPVFFGILPFAPTFLTRSKKLLSSQLVDFLPLFGVGPGHNQAEVLFETPFQSAIGFSLFEKSPSANAILIGSTGSGKSTLACGLIAAMASGSSSEKPSSFVIDVGNSFKRTIQYLGGTSLDFSPSSGTVINPFDLENGQSKPDPEKIKFLTAFFEEVLGNEGTLGKLEKALLESEIIKFYDAYSERTLSHFKKHLENTKTPELAHLAKLLTLWCKPHPYGLLLDGKTNATLRSLHLHFELKGSQKYPDLLRVAMLVIMDAVWREVRHRFPKRSLMVIDECHTIIRPSSDGLSNSSARWIEDCFRQMRKFSSAAIAISQTAKDLKNKEVGDGILANAPNRFILRQRGDEQTLREDLKLNEKELEDVFSLSQVRGSYSEFYLQSESIRGVMIYRPTPLELWLATTHPPDIELLEKESKANPHFNLAALMEHMALKYPNGSEGANS